MLFYFVFLSVCCSPVTSFIETSLPAPILSLQSGTDSSRPHGSTTSLQHGSATSSLKHGTATHVQCDVAMSGEHSSASSIHYNSKTSITDAIQTPSTAEARHTPIHMELQVEKEIPLQRTTFTPLTHRVLPRAETTIPPEVIGYTFTQGVYSPFNCLTGTFYSVSGFARCCPTTQTDCPVYTTCRNTSVVENDQYAFTCSGTGSQPVCNTGTIYKTVGDTSPNFYVTCWPQWTDGNWDATRYPSEIGGCRRGGVVLSKAKLAGVIIGCLLGGAALVAIGVFATKFYKKWRVGML